MLSLLKWDMMMIMYTELEKAEKEAYPNNLIQYYPLNIA
jgi:hypothetical protein